MTDTLIEHLRFYKSETSRHIAEAVRAVDRDNERLPSLGKKVYGTLRRCAVRVCPE